MDPVSQGLLGAVSAQLGFRQKIGRDTTYIAALAGMSPDLDILAKPIMKMLGYSTDALTLMRTHRGLSHSLFMVPIIALPIALSWWLIRNRIIRKRHEKLATPSLNNPEVLYDEANSEGNSGKVSAKPYLAPFWLLYFCIFVATGTHTLLDYCTSYGTQLLAPFSATRFALNAIAVVDIFYTGLLVLILLTCYLIRRKGTPASNRTSTIVGWVGFILSIIYIAGGYAINQSHKINFEVMYSHSEQNENIERVEAYPAIGSLMLWRVVVKTDKNWRTYRVHRLGGKPRLEKIAICEKNDLVEKTKLHPDYKTFAWFSDDLIRFDVFKLPKYTIVRACDMRYGTKTESLDSMWSLDFYYDSKTGKYLRHHLSSPRNRKNIFDYPKKIINDMFDFK